MIAATTTQVRILAGPGAAAGAEGHAAHLARLGVRPRGDHALIDLLNRAGLTGRGGAGFPTWRKWDAVAQRSRGRAVVVVNASEGEPASNKDQTLLLRRPHLVLDGAHIAAEAVAAREIVIYLSESFGPQLRAVAHALEERKKARLDTVRVRVVTCPHRYVAGEESAVVNRINSGIALPIVVPPRPFERGVGGHPTLVQNAESLAHAALIARFGAEWFRQAGTDASPGTTLVTVSGAVVRPGVYEIALGASLDSVIDLAGGTTEPLLAVLLGGYFGTWLAAEQVATLRLDAAELRAAGTSLGCGVIAVLPKSRCGLVEAARVITYLAGESAGQCGPCVRGLRSLADALTRIAEATGTHADATMLRRWMDEIQGRGECRHPDGAIRHLKSALTVFNADLEDHVSGGGCAALTAAAMFAMQGESVDE